MLWLTERGARFEVAFSMSYNNLDTKPSETKVLRELLVPRTEERSLSSNWLESFRSVLAHSSPTGDEVRQDVATKRCRCGEHHSAGRRTDKPLGEFP